tara:strand:+ start:1466 stop:2845 length:1380 start_codon:yes stop_codon:yes gene_type:complete
VNIDGFLERRLPLVLGIIFVAWTAYMLFIKFRLLHFGLATDDLFNYLNALHNTNFRDKWLFTARYELINGQTSLLFNHWQPVLLLLYPLIKIGGAEALLIVQALAPVWAAVFLLKIAEHIGLRPFDRLFVVVVCLFHPNLTAAIMDSLYGFHGTTLLLYFGAPLAWAAITGRWMLALVLLVFFLNVRESGSFYVFGAAFGFIVLGNAYFRSRRQVLPAVAISAAVFLFAIIGIPKIFGVNHIHADQATSALTSIDTIFHHLSQMDTDWHNLFLWLWPGLASPGMLMAMLPESFILMIVGKKASHWYGMTLVFAGAIAVAYGLSRIRAFAELKRKGHILTGILVLHMVAIAVAGPKEIRGQTQKLVTRIGIHIPMDSKQAARAAIDDRCRTAVELQAMYGFGNLAYLQYPRQAHQSKYIVSIPSMPTGMTQWTEANQAALKVLYEDKYLKVFENPGRPCV